MVDVPQEKAAKEIDKATKLLICVGHGPGIAQSVCRKFGENGFAVVVGSRSKKEELVAELEGKGIETHYHMADCGNLFPTGFSGTRSA